MPGQINKLYNFIFSRKTFIILIVLYIITFLASCYHRYIYVDDAWFGDQAYWFSKCGYTKVPSIIGIGGWENRLMVYHKLNIIIGAFLIKVFGWCYYDFKIFSFFVYCSFFFIYRKYFLFHNDKYQTGQFLLASMLMIINPLMIYLSFTYRPEMLVMFFGFLSFYFIEDFLKNKKYTFLIPAGIFSGLAFFTHLNAVVFPVAGFLLLLIYREYKGILIFSVFALLSCSLYTYDLWQGNHFVVFLDQIKNWPDDIRGNYMNTQHIPFFDRFINHLLSEPQRFFWSEKVFVFSALFITMLVFNFKKIWNSHRAVIIYLFLLIILLNVMGSHIAERYMIYYFPFTSLIISIGIMNIISEKKLFLKVVIIILIFGQIGISANQFVKIFRKNDNWVKRQHELVRHIPDKNARTLASYEFVFNEINRMNFVSIKTTEYYLSSFAPKLRQELFIKRCISLNIRYIILDDNLMANPEYPWFANGNIKPDKLYKEIYHDKRYVILEMAGFSN